MSQGVWIEAETVYFCIITWISLADAASQCASHNSMNGIALEGHTFASLAVNSPFECTVKCENEPRCQSYNYFIPGKLCELNNRTKEAKPKNLVDDPQRFYMTRQIDRGICGLLCSDQS